MDSCETSRAAHLAALVARFDAFEKLMDERDRRYTEGKEDDRRAVSAAFAASKEAIIKAETNQTTYNVTHNDLTRKMDVQYNLMVPHTEFTQAIQRQDERWEEVKKSIQDLRESRSTVIGKDAQIDRSHQYNQWVIGLLSGAAVALILHFLK